MGMAEETVLRKNRLRLTGAMTLCAPFRTSTTLQQFPESGHFFRLPATTAMGWFADWQLSVLNRENRSQFCVVVRRLLAFNFLLKMAEWPKYF